nr:MAG TPA: SoxW family [Bacteriophage sp.]
MQENTITILSFLREWCTNCAQKNTHSCMTLPLLFARKYNNNIISLY